MNKDEFDRRIFEIMGGVLGIPSDKLSLESSPQSVEHWDSLKHMNVVMALEDEFGVKFTDEEIVGMRKIEDIVSIVSKK